MFLKGGQNVNKSSTKVEAKFNLDNATWLNKDTKAILREKWKGQLTKDGFFVVKSERTRSQLLNQVSTYVYVSVLVNDQPFSEARASLKYIYDF